MSIGPIAYVLWIAPAALQVLIVSAMLKRRLVREFPIFFAYTTFHVVRAIALFLLRHQLASWDYFYSYWTAQAASSVLGFAVIYEIFSHVFRSHEALRTLGFMLFRWVAAVLLLVAVVAAASAPGSDTNQLMAGVVILERSVRVVQCGLLFFLFLFSSSFGLSWRHYVFGIALGFGLFASVELVAVTMRAHFGSVADATWSLVNSAAYNCTVLIWVGYLLGPQPAQRAVQMPPKAEIDEWNQALLQLIRR